MNKKVWMVAVLAFAPWVGGCSQSGEAEPVSLVTPAARAQSTLSDVSETPVLIPEGVSTPPETINGDAEARMQRCHGELQALRKVDGKRYAERKVEFDRLMSGAALYAGIRGAVQSRTQDAVDALYRYKADKLCADIGQDVLNGLARTGNAGRAL
ncbi:hypothetical protein ACTVKF_02690 [Serratia marcescens]|uniref:hypothetical protein n=1 Tax=Serratia TaxID=613 RepID=UPI000CDAA978|nr:MULTISPECIES: hypothetical protein [Serratia]POP23632.1 hypothetical protein C3R39_09255 [Serratia marcescens]POP28290.1 hypothetical protein C3R43_13070 [Serratia marcescens]WLS88716.1 hypothetical protein RAM09_04525 [Serratia marcescens]BEN62124.1 hypothetical protein SMKC069_48150 [Serratia marcescens]